jgi:hypothetical protein
MLLNVAAYNVSIQNVKVSKRERHITYRSQNVQRHITLSAHYISVTKRFVTVYIL